ncbi:uncharacterized protein LOC128469908 [Spea bombifrons]|uniref:uncharacterized protein LOC128469908 n=1 Tax=Spea bombifrons TaxID=233779 RepID=UPI00234C008D|nr:uncharacterized protein LOC128469908 [Spea bombifrons]
MLEQENNGIPPKKRKEKFSNNEVHVLVDEIMQNAEKLFGKRRQNNHEKTTIWEDIVRKVNKESGTNRALTDCKKRWSDYKRKIIRTLNEMKPITDNKILEQKFNSRQLQVLKFFNLNTESNIEPQDCDDGSLDGVCGQDSSTEDSENDAELKQRWYMHSPIATSPKEQLIYDESYDECRSIQGSHKRLKTKDRETSAESGSTVHAMQFKNLNAKLDLLISKESDNNKILESVQSAISETLGLQKKMNRLLKNNLTEMRDSRIFTEKMSKNNERVLENSFSMVNDKLDHVQRTLDTKYAIMMSSDDSDEEASMDQRAASRPSSKGADKKRKANDSPSQ